MSDAATQIAQIKASSITFTNTAIRQVHGGFVVTGQIQYQDKATKGIVLTENAEGTSNTDAGAAQMALNYMRTGNFEGVEDTQASLFGAPTAPATI